MILFVDDDLDEQMTDYALALEKAFTVKTAQTPDQALGIAQLDARRIELVIWDMMMSPGKRYRDRPHEAGTLTGSFLIEELRETVGLHVPVLLFTNRRDRQLLERFEKPAERSFARRKPDFLPSELVTLVRAIVAGSLS